MRNKQRNILILTSWSFDEALIQTYTLPYVQIMRKYVPADRKIFLFTFWKASFFLNRKNWEKQIRELEEQNIFIRSVDFRPFGLRGSFTYFSAFCRLLFKCLFGRISHIHCWCTPAGALGYLLAVFSGKKLILDSFEPHAEAMVENGTWNRDSFAFKLLFRLEKKQVFRASEVIAATRNMQEYARVKYNFEKQKFSVKPACTDLSLFDPAKLKNEKLLRELGLENKRVCVYAGKFGGIYLDQEVFDFFREARAYWGEDFHVLLLTNSSRDSLLPFLERSGFPESALTLRFVPHEEVADYLGLGDFAITPVKPVPSKKYCTPIKDGEYWALGLPVIIPAGISDDSELIAEARAGSVWNDLSVESYRKSIREIDEILSENDKERMERIRALAKTRRNFAIAEEIYRKIYG